MINSDLYEVTKTHLASIGMPDGYVNKLPETLDGLKVMINDGIVRLVAHNPKECATCGTPYTPADAAARVDNRTIYKHVL